MKKLNDYFEKHIGIPIPEFLLSTEKLTPLDESDNKAEMVGPTIETDVNGEKWVLCPPSQYGLLYGSEVAKSLFAESKGDIFLVQGGIDEFIKSCPQGYFLIGFWGHGSNSYAFYYQRVDSWSKIFFRLAYGGVYVDNKKAAEDIREFITAWFSLETAIKSKVKQVIAVDSMLSGFYKFITLKSTELNFRRSMILHNQPMRDMFMDLVDH